jgi:hypothetical protein
MFQVFRMVGIYRDANPLSPVFSSYAEAVDWLEEYGRTHPRECGAESMQVCRVA